MAFRRRKRRFGGRRRKSFRRKGGKRKFSRLLSRMGRPKAELKKVYLGIERNDGRNPVTTRADFMFMEQIGQGVGGSPSGPALGGGSTILNRIGDHIFVEYIYFNLVFERILLDAEKVALTTSNLIMRIRILEWYGFAPAVGVRDPVLGVPPVDTVANPLFSRTKIEAANVRRVLYDKRWVLQPDISFHPPSVAGAFPNFEVGNGNNPTIKFFRKKFKIRKYVHYITDPSGAPVPRNREYSMHWESESITQGAIATDGYIVIAFRDS